MEKSLYDELHRMERDHWWFRARRRIVWSLVERYLNVNSGTPLRVCELGCGTGGNLAPLIGRHQVVGIECAPEAIEYARRSLGGCVLNGRLPDNIQLPAGRFDVVLLTDVLEHVDEDAASAATALRLLRPGGVLIATVPAYQWLYSARDAHHHHFRRYGKRQFARLWELADAEMLVLSHYNSFLFPLAAAQRLARKAFGSRSESGDLRLPTPIVNSLLSGIMGSEKTLLGRLSLPFGLSLIAVVRKRRAGTAFVAAAA